MDTQWWELLFLPTLVAVTAQPMEEWLIELGPLARGTHMAISPRGPRSAGFIQQGGWEFITLGSYAGQAISGTQ